MSNFLIFKAAFNNSATPAIGTYTAEGAAAQFNRNTDISPDYYLYNTVDGTAVQWFVPTKETTDFEFVADILTRNRPNQVTYFIIADSTGTTRLRMWSVNDNWHFENSDSITTSGTEYIGTIRPSTSGGFGVFHQFRVRVRKLTASSSSVEVYVDGTLKLTATAGAALITCAKIGFVGGVGTSGPGTDAGIKNAYVYNLSGGDVIDRGVLSGAFNQFISWAKKIFATKDNVVLRSGGNIMTGTKLGRPNDDGTFSISGGTTVGGTTGYIKCYGATESTYGGAVEIGGKNIKFIFRNGAIESWSGNQNLGSSGRGFGTAYIKALNINGTAAGDILTHNAAEFVNVTGAQTIAGNKTFGGTIEFTSSPMVKKTNDPFYHLTTTAYNKGSNPSNNLYSGVRFFSNPNDTAQNKITGGLDMVYYASGYNAIGLNVRNYDENSNHRFFTVALRVSNDSTIPVDFVPSVDATINLGSSAAQWNNAYAKTVVTGGITLDNKAIDTDANGNMTYDGNKVLTNANLTFSYNAQTETLTVTY